MANPVLRKNLDVGAADAESDGVYLENCFVDTGDYAALVDCANPRTIVLGRTGTGKTALLDHIKKNADHVAELSPEALSFNYITNSTVLRFFEEAGVNLDMFYTLLWRHIITVELLKLRFDINNEAKQGEFFARVKDFLGVNKAKQRALNYLTEWGSKFWEETEYRIKEFTRKLEHDLSGSIKIEAGQIALGAEGARKLSNEQRVEVKDRGMHVVNQVQVKELHDVIEFLSDDIFDDPSDSYYLVIDRLDDPWVDDRIRVKLIKALLEAVRNFRRVHAVKIIVALRTDLHYRVLHETVQPGFQEEKYRSLYLQIRWTREQLVQLLERRVAFMYKRQYTRTDVTLADIMPKNQIDQRSAVDYLLDRTFFRPREAIIFLNECIARAEGQTRITVHTLRQAEVPYSQLRLKSLADEWRREYPRLIDYANLVYHRETPFSAEQITEEEFSSFATKILENTSAPDDPVYKICENYLYDGKAGYMKSLMDVIEILYHVGIIGVKPEPHLGRQWSHEDEPSLSPGTLKPASALDVHKTFWAALGVTSRGRANAMRERDS